MATMLHVLLNLKHEHRGTRPCTDYSSMATPCLVSQSEILPSVLMLILSKLYSVPNAETLTLLHPGKTPSPLQNICYLWGFKKITGLHINNIQSFKSFKLSLCCLSIHVQ
ncbi:hypothetical protein PGIGA_G00154250 [Pangasianodon gigas]|uniref:Uncharacterized protein n=1 Tax=Pangasianodon gigas TaxID=30993 RepID=A0ACC5XPP4_PANGG|nr:hypothetical protein [Pangasianodon gigas]